MRLWPRSTLRGVREWCDRAGALLIVDEVMTAFGRTGKMFAIEHEAVGPDMIVLGKGLSGGYLPLAMTVVTDEIFSRFDGSIADGRALAYGHSYTGNALGCAAAKASLEVFTSENVLENLQPKIEQMRAELKAVKSLAGVSEVRQCGFIAGIEMQGTDNVDFATGRVRVAAATGLAAKVCLAARSRGLLTRPIRNVIVLMPPLCTTPAQLSCAINALRDSIVQVCHR
jgi:adenosylmethionine-8-amino-7-oxononanoate aminotransferase